MAEHEVTEAMVEAAIAAFDEMSLRPGVYGTEAMKVAIEAALAARTTPQPIDDSAASGAVPPIENNGTYKDRFYIPLPGGWEIQTKGSGSSFRICDTKSGDRINVCQQPYLFEYLERMGREIHAAWSATGAGADAVAKLRDAAYRLQRHYPDGCNDYADEAAADIRDALAILASSPQQRAEDGG